MTIKIFFLILLTFLLSRCVLVPQNSYLLQKSLTQTPCSSQNTHQTKSGSQLFSNLSADLERITITGWIFVTGYNSAEYSILSIYENNNRILVFTYKIQTTDLNLYIGNASPFTLHDTGFGVKKWYFIKVYVYKTIINSTTIQLNGQFKIFKAGSVVSNLASEGVTTSNTLTFSKQDINISVGWPDSQYGFFPCCCFIKTFTLFWNDLIDDSDVFQLIGNPSVGKNNLMLKIDFQQHIINLGYLYNQAGYQDRININYNHYDTSILDSGDIISLDSVSVVDFYGFTLTFYFRILETSTQENTILIIYSDNKYMKLFIDLSGILKFSTSVTSSEDTLCSIIVNQWIQVIFIILQEQATIGNILIKSQSLDIIYPINFSSFNIYFFTLPRFEFGSLASHNKLQFSYVNIYQGSQLVSTNTCKYQISLLSGYHCLRCQDNYLIDQMNNQCVSQQSLTPQIPGLKDVQIQQCSEGQIYDITLNQCTCRKQHYMKNNQCFKCPKYCDGCSDETTCISGGLGRVNGVCSSDKFDDGYNCLSNYSYFIPNKINKVFEYSNVEYDSLCQQNADKAQYIKDNNFLDLNDGDTFYLQFTLKKKANAVSGSILCYFENDGQIIFHIKYLFANSLHFLQFFNINNEIISTIHFYDQLAFVVGIWTDLQKALIVMTTTGYFYKEEVIIGSSSVYNSPQLCIGPCNMGATPYFCGLFQSQYPIIFIKNMKLSDNKEQYDYLLSFSFKKAAISAYFVFNSNDTQNQSKAQNLINLSQKYEFLSGPILHQNIKGFATHQTFQSLILQNQNYPLTFSCSIYIESISKTVVFLEIDSPFMSFQLVPHELLNSSFIQICFLGTECQVSQKCQIEHSQVNFLMIKYNQNCIFCGSQKSDQYEIIVNYCREVIFFPKNYSTQQMTKIYIGTGNNSEESFLIYFNHFRIYFTNSFFYFSYKLSDPCFIYFDVSNLTCIYPKEGYYFYGNDIISKQECKDLSINGNILYAINEFSRECINTQLNSNLCIDYDPLNNACKECRSNLLDINTHCFNCIKGYFFDNQTSSCQPCSNQCISCEDQSDNCTECRYLNSQSTPSCQCSSYQFLSNQECIECSSNCLSCQDSYETCTQCAENRINPPSCNCDTDYYKLVNQNCVKIECDVQCDGCKQNSSQCNKCKSGRIDPPQCVCDTNYYPTENGDCLPCNSDQFFDEKSQKCLQCSATCSKCVESSDKCLECSDEYDLQDNQCLCNYGNIIIKKDGQISCPQEMDVELQVNLKNNQYQLEFIFPYNLRQINFETEDTTKIMYLYLSQIPSDVYSLTNFSIVNNKLFVTIVVTKSFQTTDGSILIHKTELFVNSSEEFVLSNKYKKKPIYFKIGPMFLQQSDLETKSLDSILESVKNTNHNVMSFLQKFQIIFYFLNTIQPTVMILLFKAQLPPNLYKLCQLYGMFVFSYVPDYQTNNINLDYSLFDYKLNSSEIQTSNQYQLSRLGFTNSLLVNIPMIIVKQCVLLLILFIISFYQFIKQLYHIKYQQNRRLQKVKVFLLNNIYDENEVNLLLVWLSVLSQYSEFEEEQWTYRFGVYISLLQILFIIIQIRFIYTTLKNKNKNQYKEIELFTSRLNFNQKKLSEYYFLIQLIKKYLIVSILFFFYNYPYFVGITLSLILLMSSYQTYYQNPYTNVRSKSFKIAGEFIMSIVWVILIVIYNVESSIIKQTVINERDIDKYIKLGNAVIFLLLIFNILYFIEFIIPLFEKVIKIINNRRLKQQLAIKQKKQMTNTYPNLKFKQLTKSSL